MFNPVDTIVTRQLMLDQRLGASSKVIYQLLRTHRKMTLPTLSDVLKINYGRLWRAVSELEKYDWVYRAPHPLTGDTLIIPGMPLPVDQMVADEFESRRRVARFVGERIAGFWFGLFVDDRDCERGSSPEWLVSGFGGQRMELDFHFFTAGVAIEFQGVHHFLADASPEAQRQLQEQQQRDALKALLCARHNVAFVEIRGTDLNYDTLVAKLQPVLPLIPLRKDRPTFRTLSAMSRSYVNYVNRNWK